MVETALAEPDPHSRLRMQVHDREREEPAGLRWGLELLLEHIESRLVHPASAVAPV